MSLYSRDYDNFEMDNKRAMIAEKNDTMGRLAPIDYNIFKKTPAERLQLKAAKAELKRYIAG